MEFYVIFNENGMDFGPYKTMEIAKQKLNEMEISDKSNGTYEPNQYSITDENGNEIK